MSIEPGAIWGQAYDAVTTKGGRYVQGGGCMTVGVAGLILGGGFGNFSKAYGTAAASLLEAEIVTADGDVKIANACSNPDLFWALKGGGGGFGVVTRVTLRTHRAAGFPWRSVRDHQGGVRRRLPPPHRQNRRILRGGALQSTLGRSRSASGAATSRFRWSCRGSTQQEAEATWRPFFDWVTASPQDFTIVSAPRIISEPARHFWDPAFLKQAPGLVISDDRPGAPADSIFWAGNLGEAGAVWYAYQSAWLPASLLETDRRESLADALFEAAKHRGVALHCNKGIAGATAEAVAATKDTAMNPAVVDAFALAITGDFGQPAYPDVPGHEPDAAAARSEAEAVDKSMDAIRKLLPRVGSYVWETDYFQPHWQDAFWGENYARLLAIKDKYDPDGLFFLHHGVGSEDWSADGFTRLN